MQVVDRVHALVCLCTSLVHSDIFSTPVHVTILLDRSDEWVACVRMAGVSVLVLYPVLVHSARRACSLVPPVLGVWRVFFCLCV